MSVMQKESKISGFYPAAKKTYRVRMNSAYQCYEVVKVIGRGSKIISFDDDHQNKPEKELLMPIRTGISTRGDAVNQTTALNFK